MSGRPTWKGVASARAGVAGNPSDALGGAALAVPVQSLGATVVVHAADRLTVRRGDGIPSWESVSGLVSDVDRVGHDGGDRLVTAALVTLWRHLGEVGTAPDDAPLEIVWRTDIPRSVGLAGSSALVIATVRALCARWQVHLGPPELARLALAAEVAELGIAAGWMDRAVQAHDAPVLVDRPLDEVSPVPPMRVVSPSAPLDLVVAWDGAGAAPSGRLHRTLRRRLEAADPEVLATVDALVEVARSAADALAVGDVGALARAVDLSCSLRDELGALDERTARMAATARACGAAATSAGSGGAILAVPRDRSAGDVALRLERAGLSTVAVHLTSALAPGSTGGAP